MRFGSVRFGSVRFGSVCAMIDLQAHPFYILIANNGGEPLSHSVVDEEHGIDPRRTWVDMWEFIGPYLRSIDTSITAAVIEGWKKADHEWWQSMEASRKPKPVSKITGLSTPTQVSLMI